MTTYSPTCDVITMVSLISLTESEDEIEPENNKDKEAEKTKNKIINKNNIKQATTPIFDPSIFANRRLGSLRRIGKSGKLLI